jgi:hypothetical protein
MWLSQGLTGPRKAVVKPVGAVPESSFEDDQFQAEDPGFKELVDQTFAKNEGNGSYMWHS